MERNVLERDVDQRAQVMHRPEDRVAQPEDLQLGMATVQEVDVHRHRVGVVEQPGVGALGAHVLREVVEEAEGA
jgi:hypothetical protein